MIFLKWRKIFLDDIKLHMLSWNGQNEEANSEAASHKVK